MLAEETRSRQDQLNNLIRKMVQEAYEEDSDKLKSALATLKSIYADNFKHNYSEFFPLIVEISKEHELDYLTNNLELLRIRMEHDLITNTGQYEVLYDPLRKLCDHLNLEISRLDYYSKNENAVRAAEQKVQQLAADIQRSQRAMKLAENKTKSLQNEMIAVLSIFAAVMIGFFGGFNYISSAIASLQRVHIYKSVTIVLIAGSILFNTIFMLMNFISKIIGRNIYAPCKTEDCSCDPKCSPTHRAKKRIPFVYWANAFFAALLLVTCSIWYWVDAPI